LPDVTLSRICGNRALIVTAHRSHPGATNVPCLANIDPKLAAVTAAEREQLLASCRSFTFASAKDLAALYENVGVTADKQVITYCGRGYAAACAPLALKLLGHEKAPV
jgi:thiosulfate/3-mercaptopyruvate sulfurtransferase